MRLFGYPYNDLVICKDSPDYLTNSMRPCDSEEDLNKLNCFKSKCSQVAPVVVQYSTDSDSD